MPETVRVSDTSSVRFVRTASGAASSAEPAPESVSVGITPATVFSLEQALEFISDDEAVEVTPKSVRLRKVILDQAGRARSRKKGS